MQSFISYNSSTRLAAPSISYRSLVRLRSSVSPRVLPFVSMNPASFSVRIYSSSGASSKETAYYTSSGDDEVDVPAPDADDNLIGAFLITVFALQHPGIRAYVSGLAKRNVLATIFAGVGTILAIKEVLNHLNNVTAGTYMLFTKQFSLGEIIKVGPIEGEVVRMGLMTTSLLMAGGFQVTVPNKLFLSQEIMYKSRALCHVIVKKIPLAVDDIDKAAQICSEIKNMLAKKPEVFLEMEPPYCFLSRVKSSVAEVSLGCNLKLMSEYELRSAEQDILLQALEIIKAHGAALGGN